MENHFQNILSTEYSVGMRQGKTISLILVSVFFEADLGLFLTEDPNSGLGINDFSIIILLFADMVIFGKNTSRTSK